MAQWQTNVEEYLDWFLSNPKEAQEANVPKYVTPINNNKPKFDLQKGQKYEPLVKEV